jgi:hypothetical protein
MNPTPLDTTAETTRGGEVGRFNGLAATWWDCVGPMRPLHILNGLRLDDVLEQIAQRFGRAVDELRGLRIADIGCGAGLICEPLAARGAQVTAPAVCCRLTVAASVICLWRTARGGPRIYPSITSQASADLRCDARTRVHQYSSGVALPLKTR